jgi:hypothetical protein
MDFCGIVPGTQKAKLDLLSGCRMSLCSATVLLYISVQTGRGQGRARVLIHSSMPPRLVDWVGGHVAVNLSKIFADKKPLFECSKCSVSQTHGRTPETPSRGG